MLKFAASVVLVAGAIATPLHGQASTGGHTAHVVTVRMITLSPTSYAFEPRQIQVHAGDTVRFVQEGAMPHNVQFLRPPAGATLGAAMMGPFLTQNGQTYSIAVDSRFVLGEYPIVCTPHQAMGMTGTISVAVAPR